MKTVALRIGSKVTSAMFEGIGTIVKPTRPIPEGCYSVRCELMKILVIHEMNLKPLAHMTTPNEVRPTPKPPRPLLDESTYYPLELVGITHIGEREQLDFFDKNKTVINDQVILHYKCYHPAVVAHIDPLTERDFVMIPRFMTYSSHLKSLFFKHMKTLNTEAGWTEEMVVTDEDSGDVLETVSVGAVAPSLALGCKMGATFRQSSRSDRPATLHQIESLKGKSVIDSKELFYYDAPTDSYLVGGDTEENQAPQWAMNYANKKSED